MVSSCLTVVVGTTSASSGVGDGVSGSPDGVTYLPCRARSGLMRKFGVVDVDRVYKPRLRGQGPEQSGAWATCGCLGNARSDRARPLISPNMHSMKNNYSNSAQACDYLHAHPKYE